jgi:hypothetical protein
MYLEGIFHSAERFRKPCGREQHRISIYLLVKSQPVPVPRPSKVMEMSETNSGPQSQVKSPDYHHR